MLKPPICRVGGKSKLRKTIIEMIPEHICYIELFFGAGWVYFGKEASKIEVINDVDRELINLFKNYLSNELTGNPSVSKAPSFLENLMRNCDKWIEDETIIMED